MPICRVRRSLFRLFFALALFGVIPGARAQYVFTLLVDSNSPTFNNFGVPAINTSGTVAFYAALDGAAGNGIFTIAGGTTTTIAASSGPTFSTFDTVPSINSSGRVAFTATLDAGGRGIYTGTGGATTTIALTSGTFETFYGVPSINVAGTVAFNAKLDTSATGIFTGAGAATTAIVPQSSTFNSFSALSPSINSSGRVAFWAATPSYSGIFSTTGGPINGIAIDDGPYSLLGNPAINASGTVAFSANIDVLPTDQGVFTGSGDAVTTIALKSGTLFDSFSGYLSINTSGTVAFKAVLDAGGSGIYVGDGVATTRVVGTGDTLNGSTVSSVFIGPNALNDSGQVCFYYSLSNGTTGLAIATLADLTTQAPTLRTPRSNAVTGNPISIDFTLPETAAIGTVKLTFTGPVTTVVTLVNSITSANVAHVFSLPTANLATGTPVASVSGPTALPDGVYTVALQYQDVAGNPAASAAATNVTLAVATYSQWKVTQFGDVNASDTGNADSDAYLNLAEYGLVLSPTAPSAGPVGELFTYPEGDRLRVVFTRDPARNDVTIEVLAADDLAGPWTTLASSVLGAVTTGAGYYGGDSAGPGLKTVEVRDVYNLGDPAHPHRFVRLKVSR